MGELLKQSVEGDKHTADFEGHTIDVFKLINLAESLEVEDVELDGLQDCIDNNKNWHDKNGNWLGAREIVDEAKKYNGNLDKVIANYPEWQDEIEKIKQADYQTHPLLFIGDNIIDGMHRLTKAWIDGAGVIRVKRFKELPEKAIIPK